MARRTQQELFPDNTYGVDSGGTPSIIPQLTFDGFRDFHGKFYHPTNARIFFYGDDPAAARLDLLDSYLSEFAANPSDSAIRWQPKRSTPWTVEEKFPATAETAEKHMVTVNWLVNDAPMSLRDSLAWGILDHLLLGTSASKLAKALTDSNLGDDLAGGGLSDELLQATYGIGLKGVAPTDVEKVEPLVLSVLEQLAQTGFEPDAITSSINTIEFQLREFNTGGFPRGLMFMLGSLNDWLYDRDPLDRLRFEQPLAELKGALERGEPVFQSLITQGLLKNGHRVTVKMTPDLTLEQRQAAEEEATLAKIKAAMTPADLQRIVAETKTLKERQAAADLPADVARLPRLSLTDIERKNREIPIAVETLAARDGARKGVTVLTHEVPSSGILYADVCFDASSLSLDEAALLPLLTSCLLETGTERKDRVALSQEIGTHTGGLRTTTILAQPSSQGGLVAAPDSLFSYVCLRGKAVSAKASRLFALMAEVASQPNLDDQRRVVEMLKETVAGYRSSIPAAGHTYADSRLRAQYSAASWIADTTGGIEGFEHAKAALKQAETDWPALCARLKAMRAKLVAADGIVINLTGDAAVLDAARPLVDSFTAALPASGGAAPAACWASAPFAAAARNEGLAVPTQVNYVAKGGQLYKPGEKVHRAHPHAASRPPAAARVLLGCFYRRTCPPCPHRPAPLVRARRRSRPLTRPAPPPPLPRGAHSSRVGGRLGAGRE